METLQTPAFATWFAGLRDARAKSAIAARIARFELGLLGTIKTLGDGVSEAKVDVGPGYRLYFTVRRQTVVILLVGGDKGSQRRDIAAAKELAAGY